MTPYIILSQHYPQDLMTGLRYITVILAIFVLLRALFVLGYVYAVITKLDKFHEDTIKHLASKWDEQQDDDE
jgi:predicted Na+-dependent transporter